MKKCAVILFIAVIGIFIITGNSWAFRCGTDLITTGDTKIKTSMTCGKPTSKEQRCLEHHPETGVCIDHGEVWYYNCGGSDFIYALTFSESGRLIKENTEGRGEGKSDCGGKLSR
jgi:hypothetical protein